ncbi:YciI family protein [Paraburkholderia phosphatilytica]|uniref:YciI family protein n=1 Tax=Paraburkholderia phosphatilytica TaxID=2282883 RepID=UPI001F0CA39F|nr:YciI family protein [Paraburkholderia phosphatilytica]
MSAYMLLIVEDPAQRPDRTPEQGRAAYAAMAEFAQRLKERGVLRGVESLASLSKGARVQVRDGAKRVVDGPFAEVKEMVGGFFLVDVDTQQEAIDIAAQCPAANWATVEVRRVAPCYE